MVSVAQLVVAPGCGLGGRGFKSHRSPQKNNKGISELTETLISFHLFCPTIVPPFLKEKG